MSYRYYKIITYGCQMNVHDSEKLAGVLQTFGMEEAEDTSMADVIIFNTCAIRKGAEDRAFGNIGALKGLKKQKPDIIIGVCGCMTQKVETANALYNTFGFVDIIFGTHNLCKFKDYLKQRIEDKKRVIDVWDCPKEQCEDEPMYRTSGNNAYVNIMQGCNNFCSYCIVPYVRGRERSRDFDSIIKEVKQLIVDGYKMITLLGQNVNSYGNDINKENCNFANLISTIAELDGDFRLKFMTSHPKDLSTDVIKAIASHEKISKAVHLPVQSGSNEILKVMNRKYTVEKYLSLVDEMRKTIDNVTISSDFIVGFPGESEEDFEKTCELVKKVRFSQIFAYIYSRRSGTLADKMENQVPYDIKNKRVNILLGIQKEITEELDKSLVGATILCFIEREKGKMVGTSDSNKKIHLDCGENILNQFAKVIITEYKNKKLLGKIV